MWGLSTPAYWLDNLPFVYTRNVVTYLRTSSFFLLCVFVWARMAPVG
jgi:hypothetical protein